MSVTDFTREVLDHRRKRKGLELMGYERVGEGGGRLWELYRGCRQGHRIVDVFIDPDGMSVWVRIAPPEKMRA